MKKGEKGPRHFFTLLTKGGVICQQKRRAPGIAPQHAPLLRVASYRRQHRITSAASRHHQCTHVRCATTQLSRPYDSKLS